MVDAETRDGKIYKTRLIRSLHDPMSINTSLEFEATLLSCTKKLFAWHPYRRAGAHFENIVYHNTMKRLSDADAGDDFFQKLMVNSRGEKPNLSMGEILAECGVIMNAGSDTTTAALTSAIFLLCKHLHALAKLREELDPVMANCEVPLYDSVASLPYLRACIEESLRIRPASSMGLPRIVPEGGRTIAGQFIEEGVTVSVPTYTLLRDPRPSTIQMCMTRTDGSMVTNRGCRRRIFRSALGPGHALEGTSRILNRSLSLRHLHIFMTSSCPPKTSN